MSTIQFNVGEKVVYPNHGVGVIEQISSRTIGTEVQRFYLLRIRSSSLKVMVPFHNAEAVGMRRVVKNTEAVRIVEYLADGKCESCADWKNRFKENSDKMRTGALQDVAMVLKGLLVQGAHKPLSFREKKMLERARFLLISELATARNREEEEIEDDLREALLKSNLRWPEAASIEV
ncbi:MAG: CarD family transcriptional regulator [Acidobacteriota bacterium]|nr:CarD family transcriptional regulator [Acidobacteriota bacterium]